MKKSIIAVLLVALVCSLIPAAGCAVLLPLGWDGGITPMYVAFTSTYCNLSVSGSTATCAAGGAGNSANVDYITVDMSLWSGPVGSGSYPTEVKTWATYTSGGASGSTSGTATVSSSKDYQLFATIKAYKNGSLVDIDYKTDYYYN